MPITITITANNAAEAAQLVHDLADTISRMSPADIPEHTEVSTVDQGPATPTMPAGSTPQPVGQAPAPVPNSTPPAPAAVPTAAPQPAVPTAVSAGAPQAAAPAPAAAPQAPQPPVAPAAPTSAPQYDFNQIATATMQLQQAGQNIYEIWAPFGIQALNQLPKERYAEYAAVLRQRGAKI